LDASREKKDRTKEKEYRLSMDDRVSLVISVISTKNIQSRLDLCKMLGYVGNSLSPLEAFERGSDDSTQFALRFSQYIAGWHPDALAKLSCLHSVFPHLTTKKDAITKNRISLSLSIMTPNKDVIGNVSLHLEFEAKFSNNREWLSLNPKTKKWILEHITTVPHITSTPLNEKEKIAIEWVMERKASVIVAHGEKSIKQSSLLVRTLVHCLRSTPRPAQYIFFAHGASVDSLALSSGQIERALIFLGFADVLIIISEFQERGFASIIKQMQDFGTHSTHDFGILLFGSDNVRTLETMIAVFYSVRSVCVNYDPVPVWLL
jgi:hypothetical protein